MCEYPPHPRFVAHSEYKRGRFGYNIGHPGLVDARDGHLPRSTKACPS